MLRAEAVLCLKRVSRMYDSDLDVSRFGLHGTALCRLVKSRLVRVSATAQFSLQTSYRCLHFIFRVLRPRLLRFTWLTITSTSFSVFYDHVCFVLRGLRLLPLRSRCPAISLPCPAMTPTSVSVPYDDSYFGFRALRRLLLRFPCPTMTPTSVSVPYDDSYFGFRALR